MRRATPAFPISPKLLKHFAAATVAITIVIAMIAGGEDAGVAAEVQARQAKNDLIAAEQKKLGTKKIGNALKVQSQVGFGPDEGGGDFAVGGGGGSVAPAVSAPRRNLAWGANDMPQLPGKGTDDIRRSPGATPSQLAQRKRYPGGKSGDGEDDFGSSEAGPGAGPGPNPENLSKIIESSRQRSGAGDD